MARGIKHARESKKSDDRTHARVWKTNKFDRHR
jgi:hypothetical protein